MNLFRIQRCSWVDLSGIYHGHHHLIAFGKRWFSWRVVRKARSTDWQ